jgi:serine/threonine-protein kinase
MEDHGTTDSYEEEHPLDAGIRAAFGSAPERSNGAVATSSVLHIVSQRQEVPHVLLRDIDPDDSAIVRTHSRDAGGCPAQIGRYHIVGEIARGGVGLILRARDLDLGRDVAIKLLLQKYRGNAEMIRRFLEEAQIGGQLQHPGIVPIHEIGIYDEDLLYLVMKLVRGRTLAELLESREAPEKERQQYLTIFEQVCQTLAYAHSKGVIHRDLKPSNVMVGAFGEVQIMDWGLAKVLLKGGVADEKRTTRLVPDEADISTLRSEDAGSQSIAGSVMGTPSYMPPEQARGEVDSLDERSDVFGLGAILCEILTGKPPYLGKNVEVIYQKARAADLEDAFVRLDACGADQELLGIAKSCLRATAEERPRNAIVVSRRVQDHLESTAARARALEVRATKNRFRLSLAVTVILALILGGSAYIFFEKERQEQSTLALSAVNQAELDAERFRVQAETDRDLATWEAALREANRAVELAGPILDEEVRRRVRVLRDELLAEIRDQRMLARLERLEVEARDQRVLSSLEPGPAAQQTERDELFLSFRDAFSRLGIDVDGLSVGKAAGLIRNSSIAPSLIDALDQWLLLLQNGRLSEKLLEIAQAADDDEPWRRRVRAAFHERDREELSRLTEEIAAREPGPSTLELLATAVEPPWRPDRRSPPADTGLSERVWRRAQEIYPDDFWINIQLGTFLSRKRKNSEAIQYLRIAVALRPKSAYARYELGAALEAEGNIREAIHELRKSIALDPYLPSGKSFYKALEALQKGGNDAVQDEAVQGEVETLIQTLAGIRSSRDPFHREALAQLLAQALSVRGDLEDAIRALEDSLRTDPVMSRFARWRGIPSREEQLREYRNRLLPDLATYASIDAGLEASPEGTSAGENVEAFEKLHGGDPDPRDPRLIYIEGRSLEREGRLPEAISRYREVTSRDDSLPEPWLRLALCLRANDQVREAEQALRDALKRESNRCPAIWDLWVEVSFKDLGKTAPELLSCFESGEVPTARGLPDRGGDIYWLLVRLSTGSRLLINCGGEDYAGPEGSTWSRDRFFDAASQSFLGRAFFGEIAETDEDPLYQTERWFPPGGGDPSGYRIPLPRGSYEVTLHFAEIFFRPDGIFERDRRRWGRRFSGRSFDILVEGKVIRENYSPVGRGFAVADRIQATAVVSDGFLDIRFRHRNENPKISAIAVQAVR